MPWATARNKNVFYSCRMDVASFFSRTKASPEELAESDRVYGDLTEAVRELSVAQLATLAPYDEVEQITAEIRALVRRLEKETRSLPFGIQLDADDNPRNHGNSVVGLRNPMAVALGEHAIVWNERGASARLFLGPLYEGPPGHVHGGVLALLLDQLFGEAAASGGAGGMTGRLSLSYRRPTPLGEVSMNAWVDSVDGHKTIVKGTFSDTDGNVTVEAEGLFILPSWVREAAGQWPKRKRRFE